MQVFSESRQEFQGLGEDVNVVQAGYGSSLGMPEVGQSAAHSAASPFGMWGTMLIRTHAGANDKYDGLLVASALGSRQAPVPYHQLSIQEKLVLASGVLPDLDVVKQYIVQFGVNRIVSSDLEYTCLEWASRKGNQEIVKFLVNEAKANVNVGYPFIWACYTDQKDIAVFLHEKGVNAFKIIPGSNANALSHAAENGAIKCTTWLLDNVGISPFAKIYLKESTYSNILDFIKVAVPDGGKGDFHYAIMGLLKKWLGHYQSLEEGVEVELVGLKKVELNGMRGILNGKVAKNRVSFIPFTGNRTPISIKSVNLLVVKPEPHPIIIPPNLATGQWNCQSVREASYKFLLRDEMPLLKDATGRVISDVLLLTPGSLLTIFHPAESQLQPQTFKWHDPASLAMELFMFTSGGEDKNDWRHLEGGLSYMWGEVDLFFSMALLFKQTKTILPPLSRFNSSYSYLEGTVPAHEIEQFMEQGRTRSSSSSPVTLESTSLAAVCTLKAMSFQGVSSKALPWMIGNESLPTESNHVPKWWTSIAAIWDVPFREYVSTCTPQCMFYGIPFGYGCAKDQSCPFRHADRWVDIASRIREFKFLFCDNCESFADKQCDTCQARWFCSDNCKSASGHHLQCVKDKERQMALADSISLASIRGGMEHMNTALIVKLWKMAQQMLAVGNFEQPIRLLTRIIDKFTLDFSNSPSILIGYQSHSINPLQIISSRALCYLNRAEQEEDADAANAVIGDYQLATTFGLTAVASEECAKFEDYCKRARVLLINPIIERVSRNIQTAESQLSVTLADQVLEDVAIALGLLSIDEVSAAAFRVFRERANNVRRNIEFLPPSAIRFRQQQNISPPKKSKKSKPKKPKLPSYQIIEGPKLLSLGSTNTHECPICFNEWAQLEDPSLAVKIPCGHSVCVKCLLRSKNACSETKTKFCCCLCRGTIDTNSLDKLIFQYVVGDKALVFTDFAPILQLSRHEVNKIVACLIMTHAFDMEKIATLLFNMASLRTREENMSLSVEEKQEIYRLARAPILKLEKQLQILKSKMEQEYDTRSAVLKGFQARSVVLNAEIDEARRIARESIYTQINQAGLMGVESATGGIIIDLHCLTPAEARSIFSTTIGPVVRVLEQVTIITGKGNHSAGESMLKQHIKAYIISLGFYCKEVKSNSGRMVVRWTL